MSYDFKKNIKNLLIEHKKSKGYLKEEIVGQTKDPNVFLYRVETGETEGSISQKFNMSEEDYTRLNPEPFRGEGSTIKIIKRKGECEEYPIDEEFLEKTLSKLDYSNLKAGFEYKHIAGDVGFQYFKHGKGGVYGYMVGALDNTDFLSKLPEALAKQLKSLGGQINLLEFIDAPNTKAKIFSKMPPVLLAVDDGVASLIQWKGKQFAKGTKKFPSTLDFAKEIIKIIDQKLKPVGGLDRANKCLQ